MKDAQMRLLAILQRKLDAELERARASLAALRQQARVQERDLHDLQACREQHERRAGVRPGEPVDPARRGHALRHLVHLRADLVRNERAAQELHARIDQAVARCVAQDVRCEATRKLRDDLQQQGELDARRRAASEADRAWLARCARAPGAGE